MRLSSSGSALRQASGKAMRRRATNIIDALTISGENNHALLVLCVEFAEGDPQQYLIPVMSASGEELTEIEHRFSHAIIAYVDGLEQPTAIVDSVACGRGAPLLLSLFRPRMTARGSGRTQGFARGRLKQIDEHSLPLPKPAEFEQTNSTLLFGDQLLLKIYRQVESGVNSELEIGEFLTSKVPDCPVPRVLGGLTYRSPQDNTDAVIGLVQEFVPNQGTAWDMAVDRVGSFFDSLLSQPELTPPTLTPGSRVARADLKPDQVAWDLVGSYLASARKLGTRTAEVHVALGSRREPGSFAPEPFTTMHQQSIYQWSRALMVRTFQALRKTLKQLPEDVRADVEQIVAREAEIERNLRKVTTVRIDALRIRCHGDLHLGQVLNTGDDFVLIDFEGEPAKPLSQRGYKRCALRDVMGMMRSFNYVTESVLRGGRYRDRDIEQLRPWARYWEEQVSSEYLGGYLEVAVGKPFIPKSPAQIELLLNFYAIEKAVYEINYEMNNRPAWLAIPVAGLQSVLDMMEESNV